MVSVERGANRPAMPHAWIAVAAAVILVVALPQTTAGRALLQEQQTLDGEVDANGHSTSAEQAAQVAMSYKYDTSVTPRDLQGSGPRPNCVCAFDFDLTLRVEQPLGDDKVNYDAPAEEAPDVFKACQGVPCYIGLASANHDWAKIQKVLARNYKDSGVFTPDFFVSTAFQFGWHNKTISLLNLADYFQVDPECIALFDDAMYNKKYATRVGASFELVKKTTGVQMWNFRDALQHLPSRCTNPGGPDEPPMSTSRSERSSAANTGQGILGTTVDQMAGVGVSAASSVPRPQQQAVTVSPAGTSGPVGTASLLPAGGGGAAARVVLPGGVPDSAVTRATSTLGGTAVPTPVGVGNATTVQKADRLDGHDAAGDNVASIVVQTRGGN